MTRRLLFSQSDHRVYLCPIHFLQRKRTTQHGYVGKYNTDLAKPLSFVSGAAAAMHLLGHMGHWTARLPGVLARHQDTGCSGGSHVNRKHKGHGDSQAYSCLWKLFSQSTTDTVYQR